jgi:hypothetical protein
MRHMHYFYEASENNVHSRIGGGIAFIHRAAESMNFRKPVQSRSFCPRTLRTGYWWYSQSRRQG